ncbi:hypothetical protein ABW20_dc0101931 [Dactylellina cionopaga]|nr:hypothetical protein ABW20_dc0101931 [Dactylellina cionopaga]
MSLLEGNLLDLQQPQANDKTPLGLTPSRSLAHYQRAEKPCISIQVLPYARPCVVALSKVQTSNVRALNPYIPIALLTFQALATVLATLPEIWASTRDPNEVGDNIKQGVWRLVDEAGLVIRIQDWEDLLYPGAHIIIDTHASVNREAERIEENRIEKNRIDENKVYEKKIHEDKIHEDKIYEDKIHEDKMYENKIYENKIYEKTQEEEEEVSEAERYNTEKYDSAKEEPVPASEIELKWSTNNNWNETPNQKQGDMEWMTWNTQPVTPANDSGWDVGGHVAPTDDGRWGDQADDRSSSTRSSRQPFRKPGHNWHGAQAGGNTWDKRRFPPKVHLTFYVPFQLPRKYPPTPSPSYSRFSIELEAPMWEVARRVAQRPPFDVMRPPPNSDQNECQFNFLELDYVMVKGRPSLERGLERRIRGGVTLAELGFAVDGGGEGMGR